MAEVTTAKVAAPGAKPLHGAQASITAILESIPAPFLLVAGMVSLQLGSAFAKELFERTGPAGASLLRLVIAATLLCLFFRPAPGLLRSHWQLLLPYGAVLAVMQLSFYEATSRLPLGVVVALEYTGPLLIALVGSRKASDVFWVLLAAVGLVVLGGSGAGTDPVGVFASLLTGVALAGYILLGSAVSRATGGGSGLAMGMAVAAVLALPGSFLLGLPPASSLLDPSVLLVALVVASLSTAVPFSLEFIALRRMPPRAFAVLSTLDPVIAALVGLVVLGEALSVPQWVAVLCVVLAAVAVSWDSRTEAARIAVLEKAEPGAESEGNEEAFLLKKEG